VGAGHSTTTSSSVASKSLKVGTFAPAIPTESGPLSASSRIERLTPFLAYRWDSGLRGPSKTRLPHRSVRRLPLEVHPAKPFALVDELLIGQYLVGSTCSLLPFTQYPRREILGNSVF
jgi:hypothetical protein